MTTTPQPIPKTYDPHGVEERLYRFWEESGLFHAEADPSKEPFTIILPPPNVTGVLHIGHALTAAVEDALIRRRRMQGYSALWLPGTDHAATATQVVVEREIAKEGLTKEGLGRERFLGKVWEWVELSKNRITRQHKALGVSFDWSRERFTMDPGPSRAVRATFVNLYNKGLIYRGERLVNWSPGLLSAISDLEVEHREVEGHLWRMRYPLEDGSGHVTIATTRPETYLGDTAVAVHPDDARFTGLVGKNVVLPLIGRPIPIVADEAVEAGFGAGALKVTPGHDPTDFEIGARHGLPIINIMNPDGTINEHGGPFAGQDRFEARDNIVAEFERLGLLDGIEPHTHSIGHCQRSGAVVEPLISKQWFVKVGSHDDPDSIAGRAYRAVVDGEIRIVPERFTKVYTNWMENIRDWTISRQLWFGHRIPVWHCAACGTMTSAMDDPTACSGCGSADIEQDPDVLDTWFSSGLWPHSTLGWPDDTDDLRHFYPTSVLETGYDILFFWVARMIMLGIENTGEIPFRTVYLHGIIRDASGEKMSKMKGNIVDPLDTIREYGADALRFALTTGSSPGNDSRLTQHKLESSRNFANKMWNASRFVLTAVDTAGGVDHALPTDPPAEDRWILSRLQRTIENVGRMMDDFQIGEAQREIYEFLWSEYADWYIELAKIRLRREDDGAGSPLPVLVHVLETTMRLLHPFMPFVTEEIWQNVVRRLPDDDARPPSIVTTPYPETDASLVDEAAEREIGLVIQIIQAVRNARAELKADPRRSVEAIVDAPTQHQAVERNRAAIEILARAEPLRVYGGGDQAPAVDQARVAVLGETRVIMPMAGFVDLDAERERLGKERKDLAKLIANLEQRLANENFTSKAPAAVIEKERGRLAEYETRVAGLDERLRELA